MPGRGQSGHRVGAGPDDQVARREHPQQPEHDAGGQRGRADPDDPAPRQVALAGALDDRAGLETDEQEDGVLQDEGDRPPVQPLGDPRLRRLQDRRLVTQQQAGHDDGDHARRVHLLGGDVRRERDHQGEAAVEHRVGQVPAELGDDEEEDEADHHASAGGKHEVEADVDDVEPAALGDRQRGAERDQRGRVVEQGLALEDRHDPPGQPDPAADRGRRHRVRRCDDGPDRECDRPRDAGQQQVRHQPDPERRERHQPDRQQQDRSPVGLEVDQRGALRRGVQEGRQQPEQHDVLGELDVRHHRDVGRHDPDEDQQERSRDVHPLGHPGAREHPHRQAAEQEGDVHGGHSPDRRPGHLVVALSAQSSSKHSQAGIRPSGARSTRDAQSVGGSGHLR